jgi:transposase
MTMTNPSFIPPSEIAAWVGLDWADQHHVISLQAADSSRVESSLLKQDPAALQAWVSQLQARFPGRKVAIALEQSRGAVVYALMSYDFLVLYPVNPKSLAKYREAFYPSGVKDDPEDADLLRELVQKHHERLRAWVADEAETRRLQLLVEHRRDLINERTRLIQQLTGLLKTYFPQALDWVGGLETLQACDFLERWPTLEAVQKSTPARLRQFYLKHGCRGRQLVEQRLEQIQTAQPLTRDRAVIQAQSLMVQSRVGQLRALLPALQQFDSEIEKLFGQHPDHDLFASFPGAGPALAPRLLAAFGSDRDRLQAAREMQQLSGIAPITKKSGHSKTVRRRLACPKFLLQTFHEFAAQSRFQCQWAEAFYQQLRARGKGHHAAIRALAYKWIRILFRCWQARTPYNEPIYLAALHRRQRRRPTEILLEGEAART